MSDMITWIAAEAERPEIGGDTEDRRQQRETIPTHKRGEVGSPQHPQQNLSGSWVPEEFRDYEREDRKSVV